MSSNAAENKKTTTAEPAAEKPEEQKPEEQKPEEQPQPRPSLAQQQYDALLDELSAGADEYQGMRVLEWDTYERVITPIHTGPDGKPVQDPPTPQVVIAIQTAGRLYELTWPQGTIEPRIKRSTS